MAGTPQNPTRTMPTRSAAAPTRGGAMGAAMVALYLPAYVFLDWVSYVHPVLPLGITPWNPPPGLSIFLLLRAGVRYWPALFVAAVAADVVVRGAPGQFPALLAAAGIITAPYTLATLILLRAARIRPSLDTARDLGLFLVVIVPTTLAVAALYVGLHTLAGMVPARDFAANAFRYWVGDLNGILVLVPALMAHAAPASWRRAAFSRRMLLECAAQLLGIAVALWAVFAAVENYEFKFFSLLFLPLVWVAARWGLSGATLALAAIQLGLILIVQTGSYHAATFVQLQFLMLALCVAGLVLGAVVTQRKQVEASLREKQAALNRALQFAAAGEMTSAMAHELNQPIAALSNYLGACQLLAQAPGENRALLDRTMAKAAAEARRASEVVHRLRDFYRSGRTRPESIPAQQLVDDAVNALRGRTDRAGIRVHVRAEPQPMVIRADPLQIETALQNLLVNAADALAAAPAGRREIEVVLSVADGELWIAVEDTGPGLAPDARERLFEPFNTSKAEGMGMGLAISRSLVQANGGELSAEPRAGGGARFVLKLPLHPAAAENRR
ncbi:MAG: MASE1 domain-containing protein [Gammaproteobacteria bacterium]|nr:MASE1 domain-containing protein [Gammaproteobacteria bacterium]